MNCTDKADGNQVEIIYKIRLHTENNSKESHMQRPPTTNQQYSVLAATQCPQSTVLCCQEADTVFGAAINLNDYRKNKWSDIIMLRFRIISSQLHKHGEHLKILIFG